MRGRARKRSFRGGRDPIKEARVRRDAGSVRRLNAPRTSSSWPLQSARSLYSLIASSQSLASRGSERRCGHFPDVSGRSPVRVGLLNCKHKPRNERDSPSPEPQRAAPYPAQERSPPIDRSPITPAPATSHRADRHPRD